MLLAVKTEDVQRPFHKELMNGYEEAKAYIGKYLSGRVLVKSTTDLAPMNPMVRTRFPS